MGTIMSIPGYQILTKLAEAPQSAVFKAYNKKNPDRLLVHKILKARSLSEAQKAQFIQRIEHLRILNDSLVITPISFEAKDEVFFLTQDFFPLFVSESLAYLYNEDLLHLDSENRRRSGHAQRARTPKRFHPHTYRWKIIRRAVVHTDITELKRAANAPRESERENRELLETANSIIIRWDKDGIVRFINDYGLRTLGYSAEELLGQHVKTIVPRVESTGRDLDALDKDILKNPEKYVNVTNENIRKDGKTIWISWTNKAILDEQGNVREILAIGNDITALKEAEASIRESRAKLEESNKALEGFAYIISHDLRAPLRAINGYACMLAEEYGPSLQEERKRRIDTIVTNATLVAYEASFLRSRRDFCTRKEPHDLSQDSPH